MSASREKKKRQVLTQQGISPKQLAAQKAAKKKKQTKIITALVSILVLVVILGSIYLGLILPNTAPKTKTALQVADHEITAAELNFYYMDNVYQFYNMYGSYLSYLIDTSISLDNQYYDEEAGVTWADYFLDEASKTAATCYALYDDAIAAGMGLTEEQQADLDAQMEAMEQTLSTSDTYKNMDDYFAKAYGKGSDEATYRKYLEMQMVVDAYCTDYEDSLTYTDEEVDEVYAENPQQYTSVTYRSFYMSKSYFEDTQTAEDETEETEDTALAAAEEKAKAMVQACKGDEAAFAQWAYDTVPESSQSMYEDKDATLSKEYGYDDVSSYGRDWLYDEARQEGDTAYFAANESGYYVYYFVNKTDNDYATVNVRQIYVGVTQDQDSDGDGTVDTISDEVWSSAESKANELLQEWKDGEATEDSFATLAQTNSADTNTSANGGLLENIGHYELADDRNDWCYDESRKAGDTEIIKTDAGYYILYFVGEGANRRASLIRADLKEKAYNEWYTAYQEKYEHTLVESGVKYVNKDIMLSSV